VIRLGLRYVRTSERETPVPLGLKTLTENRFLLFCIHSLSGVQEQEMILTVLCLSFHASVIFIKFQPTL
jgi:hypothetical protein